MIRALILVTLAAFSGPAVAQELEYPAEKSYSIWEDTLTAAGGDRNRAWTKYPFFHRAQIWKECRRVHDVEGQPLDGVLTVGPGDLDLHKPVIVYIDGDIGSLQRTGRFGLTKPENETLYAVNSKGAYVPERHSLAMTTCANMVKPLQRGGNSAVMIARVGLFGSDGHHGQQIRTQAEVDHVAKRLDALSALGVENMIVVGFSAGAGVGALAVHGRENVSLFISAAGVLSGKHQGYHPGHIEPATAATREMPDTLIIHSIDDGQVPVRGAQEFRDRLIATGVRAELTFYEGSHGQALAFLNALSPSWDGS